MTRGLARRLTKLEQATAPVLAAPNVIRVAAGQTIADALAANAAAYPGRRTALVVPAKVAPCGHVAFAERFRAQQARLVADARSQAAAPVPVIAAAPAPRPAPQAAPLQSEPAVRHVRTATFKAADRLFDRAVYTAIR